MRKIITIALILTSSMALFAQAKGDLSVKDLTVQRSGENVELSFNLNVGTKVIKNGYRLVISPKLRKGDNALELTNITLQDNRGKIAEKRHFLAAGKEPYNMFYSGNRQELKYVVAFPFQEWMSGSELFLDGVSVGCCSYEKIAIGQVAQNILYSDPVLQHVTVKDTVNIEATPTTGDKLALKHKFIAPITDFNKSGVIDYNMPLNMAQGQVDAFIAENREGSLNIYFHQAKYVIDRYYMTNNTALVDLISSIRMIESSDDSKILRIVIAGYASPEGTLAGNERLAQNRADVLKEFITTNTKINPEVIHLYNGAEDWYGLRTFVSESDMPDKYQILRIIDNYPIWDPVKGSVRKNELMKLRGGESYNYMYQNYFPVLRQAAYIKVYYENK